MNYIDIHCHVNFAAYDTDREEVIARAREAGVGMILVGSDQATSELAVDIAAKHENMWAIIGLHPTDVATGFDTDFFTKLAAHPKVVGIGECGLDYFHVDPVTNTVDKQLQESIFRAHIELSEKVQKPLMLHIRSSKIDDAYQDAITILSDLTSRGLFTQGGDVHFFAGNLDCARQFIELGFSLSFTGVITFAKEYEEVIKNIPLERIMSETDAPFVTPAPYRGKRNEPSYVVEVVKKIASIRGEEETAVATQLVKNAQTLFKL